MPNGPGRPARAFLQQGVGPAGADFSAARVQAGGAARAPAAEPGARALIEAARSGGRSLDQQAGAELGHALDADFRGVRVHTDEQADRLSRSLNASAFTLGTDIFFRAGQYDPGTRHGRRLLAHELTHVIQQSASIGAAPGLGLTPADDPGEREAERAAQDVARDGRARPPAIIARAPLIQRKAFIGEDPETAVRAEFDLPFEYLGEEIAKDAVEWEKRDLGTGDRNVETLVTDQKSRYFGDPGELYAYARGDTKDIGYVDREKTWVRLPAQFLVLGEHHDLTTLPDLVEATGTDLYIYEAGGNTRPSPYLQGEKTFRAAQSPHGLEEMLPKLVIGLIGVVEALQQGQHGAMEAAAAALADPAVNEQRYRAALERWSSGWETLHQGSAARGWLHAEAGQQERVGARVSPVNQYLDEQPIRVLEWAAPGRPYNRLTTEVALTREALEQLRTAARGKYRHSITRFYARNQRVIDDTIAELSNGWPVHRTQMAAAGFDLHGLISLLTKAANKEFRASAVPRVSSMGDYGRENRGPIYETAPAGHAMEVLRDSYMLHRILEAKAAGCRVAGLGDKHRENLERALKRLAPDILVMRWTTFYAGQYRLHPDRD